mmetsp:Transcript_41737/g.135342  ORF Transcript_41737/g.135342 Transcript_41737/m.135342 type:complete len:182 (+) Transcript_41737:209-754(+)
MLRIKPIAGSERGACAQNCPRGAIEARKRERDAGTDQAWARRIAQRNAELPTTELDAASLSALDEITEAMCEKVKGLQATCKIKEVVAKLDVSNSVANNVNPKLCHQSRADRARPGGHVACRNKKCSMLLCATVRAAQAKGSTAHSPALKWLEQELTKKAAEIKTNIMSRIEMQVQEHVGR